MDIGGLHLVIVSDPSRKQKRCRSTMNLMALSTNERRAQVKIPEWWMPSIRVTDALSIPRTMSQAWACILALFILLQKALLRQVLPCRNINARESFQASGFLFACEAVGPSGRIQ